MPASSTPRVGVPRNRALLSALLLPYTWIFLANSWTGDDAFISYRGAWNLIHGYGFTYNPVERVQAFTNPLWTALLALTATVTGEFYYTAQFVSWLCGAAVLGLIVRGTRHWTIPVASLLLLVSSKAFIDYSSSGLETPLSYLLVAAVSLRTLDDDTVHVNKSRRLGVTTLLAAVAYVNRPDTVLLTGPCVAWQVVTAWPSLRSGVVRPLIAGATPAAAWLLFSLVYYGFPFPNSYYAKVATGLPSWMVLGQGVAYLVNSLSYDPLTLVTVAGAVMAAIATRRTSAIVVMASAMLYVAYTIKVGGDFMSGRFFALPFLQAVLVLGRLAPAPVPLAPVAAVIVIYTLLNPLAPIKTDNDYAMAWPWRQQNGIKDERGGYHIATNLLRFDPLRPMPDFVWVREGLSARSAGTRVLEHGSIGFVGYYGGPGLYVIDRNALSDPLLARLPVSDRIHFEFYAGHFFRDIPDGYVESRQSGTNRLTDPMLHDLYDVLMTVVQGPLFSADRFRAIWRLNAGDLAGLHARVRATRPVSLSVRAGHWRFTTDIGERDAEQRWLRSTGRAGYLQLGPRIPLRVGTYEAHWLGSVQAAPSPAIGRVEAWSDDQLLGSQRVEGSSAGLLDVTLPFVVTTAADRVDYRFLVNDGVQITLERIELRGK
jgi:arabinofuranosyltransferase